MDTRICFLVISLFSVSISTGCRALIDAPLTNLVLGDLLVESLSEAEMPSTEEMQAPVDVSTKQEAMLALNTILQGRSSGVRPEESRTWDCGNCFVSTDGIEGVRLECPCSETAFSGKSPRTVPTAACYGTRAFPWSPDVSVAKEVLSSDGQSIMSTTTVSGVKKRLSWLTGYSGISLGIESLCCYKKSRGRHPDLHNSICESQLFWKS